MKVVIVFAEKRLTKSANMNTEIKGYWENAKDKLKSRYNNLTEDDLFFTEGKESIMLERLEYKLGKSKMELRDILSHL